jgi:hypothetical protein
MSSDTIFSPGPTPNIVCAADGNVVTVPDGWVLLPPGDKGLTRRVKAAGDYWAFKEKRGGKEFTLGIWAAATTIDRIRAELDAERSTEKYAKKKEIDARHREKIQADYVKDFLGAVVKFLAFHPNHADLAAKLARAVTDHATPVGSGTVARTKRIPVQQRMPLAACPAARYVARTKRIPVQQRAEATVIAWMRHQTTAYESLSIPRVKGKRQEVRRMLAQRSQELLDRYPRGEPVGDECPLKKVLVVEANGRSS